MKFLYEVELNKFVNSVMREAISNGLAIQKYWIKIPKKSIRFNI
jgi:hypothetical protein